MNKLRLLAASSAAALALLVSGAAGARAATVHPNTGGCTYYTDFSDTGGQLHAYDTKNCGSGSVPAYVVIYKNGIPVAYGLSIVTYTCQGSAVNTYTLGGDIDPTEHITPGALPCG